MIALLKKEPKHVMILVHFGNFINRITYEDNLNEATTKENVEQIIDRHLGNLNLQKYSHKYNTIEEAQKAYELFKEGWELITEVEA